jgi:hypothetical protein
MAGRYRVGSKEARTVDGIVFDSKAEANRYRELRLMERIGAISDLERQPEFEIIPAFEYRGKKERAVKYRADFRYCENGQVVIEDVKGHRTDVYRIKRKLLLHQRNDIDFREVIAK